MIRSNSSTFAQRNESASASSDDRKMPYMRRSSATLGTTPLAYLDAGRRFSPVMLLILGTAVPAYASERLIANLAGSYRVIAPQFDLGDGVGLDWTTGPSSRRAERLIIELIDHLSVSRFALYTIDMGVLAGWKIMSTNRGRVTSLIVQNGIDALAQIDGADARRTAEHMEHRSPFNDLFKEMRSSSLASSSRMPPAILFLLAENDCAAPVGCARPFAPELPALEIHIGGNDLAGIPVDGEMNPQVCDFLARHGDRERPAHLSL